MSAEVGSQSKTQDGFEGTARDFWSSRPRRPRRGRKIAGVAAGIGNRYGIDPVIVRVALIVATILGGGLGVLVYLIGWLFLPEEGDEVSGAEALIGRGRSSMPPPLVIGLCIALFPASGWAFSGSWLTGGGFVMLGLMAAGLYLLHRDRGQYNRPDPAVRGASGAAPASFHAQSTTGTTATTAEGAEAPEAAPATEATTAGYTAPPGWDPLGAAPFAWDLPEPGLAPSEPRPPRPPRRRSPVSALTFGLALITAGVGTALLVFEQDWFTPAHIVGLTLAVIGLGMVIGAFTGGARSLSLLAVPLAIAGIVLTTVPFDKLPPGGFGEIIASPKTVDQVELSYQLTGGDIQLDLTGVPVSEIPIKTKVLIGMGQVDITVPDDADVTFNCSAVMGDVDCLGRKENGMGDLTVADTDNGDDGPGGQRIVLEVSARMGDVAVHRG